MTAPPKHPSSKRWSWRSQAFRALVYQVLAVAVIALLVVFLAHNTATNMRPVSYTHLTLPTKA